MREKFGLCGVVLCVCCHVLAASSLSFLALHAYECLPPPHLLLICFFCLQINPSVQAAVVNLARCEGGLGDGCAAMGANEGELVKKLQERSAKNYVRTQRKGCVCVGLQKRIGCVGATG